MLSRARYLAAADRTLRFYREYFAPETEVEVNKDRMRWRVIYQETDCNHITLNQEFRYAACRIAKLAAWIMQSQIDLDHPTPCIKNKANNDQELAGQVVVLD